MTAFKDLWQEQRRLRQAEILLRKQEVRDILTSFEQERQVMASQLRDDLNLFQLELQHETQTFLTNANKQRQAQAEQLTQLLRNFVQILQYQTAEFLAASAADRSLMAQQLTQDLSRFHSRLITSVITLRQALQARMQEIQAEVQMLQAETQDMLVVNREQRLQAKELMVQELAAFVDGLRIDVQNYLSELELVRQDRAQQLQQMLQLDRERRTTEVDAMFQELSEFRTELRQYCVNLRSLVWGGEGASQPEAVKSQAPQPKPQPKPQPQVQPRGRVVAATRTMPRAVPQVRATTPTIQSVAAKHSQTAQATQPTVQTPIASAPTPSPAELQPVVTPSQPAVITPAPMTEATIAQPEVLTVVTNPSPKPVQLDSAELEKEIYNHVHQVKGARLTEIESALGINRFQAVDALRSLIKKGLITQRDRIYLIQEEASL
ncbi:MAG: hypothetical protein SFY66_14470 [Oculatellaceae cyanobacterium bins.114]|nr:hypothetical protein [Oculatellaceae cyanobacterium bins.114]